MSDKLLASFKEAALEKEQKTLYQNAAFSKDHSRFFDSSEDHRLPYKRDVDRIIHSKAYCRYSDKTQVVYLVDNDHITHRALHVQLVSNFSRGIAEILGYNLDLVEAISLGHDVGHPPFGHEGEGYLSALCEEYTGKPFAHPWQSCRLFTKIEPLDLGLAVYDGFLCHDGGMQDCFLKPRFGKTWDDHFKDLELKLKNVDVNIMPGTLEGCLVKLCDTMSYIGRDLEDAISLGIIKREEIPETHLGSTNRDILRNLAQDIIASSYQQDYISLSQDSFEALKILRRFNFERIYFHPKLKVESKKIEVCYRILFERLLADCKRFGSQSQLHQDFLKNKSKDYLDSSSIEQYVVDYIAGMTDNFFVKTFQKLIVPTQIVVE